MKQRNYEPIPDRAFLDNDILKWLPCPDGRLFQHLRPWPYDIWAPRFRRLLDRGVIRYVGGQLHFGDTLPSRSGR